jgi:cyclase
MYGSSSIIQSIDLTKNIKGDYSIKVDSGRNLINRDTNDYISFISSLNIGEILLNSIDNDGGLMGFDLALVNEYSSKVNVPVIVQGGGGNWNHFFDVLKLNNVSGACTQNIYHFTETSLKSAKKFLNLKKINVRYDN